MYVISNFFSSLARINLTRIERVPNGEGEVLWESFVEFLACTFKASGGEYTNSIDGFMFDHIEWVQDGIRSTKTSTIDMLNYCRFQSIARDSLFIGVGEAVRAWQRSSYSLFKFIFVAFGFITCEAFSDGMKYQFYWADGRTLSHAYSYSNEWNNIEWRQYDSWYGMMKETVILIFRFRYKKYISSWLKIVCFNRLSYCIILVASIYFGSSYFLTFWGYYNFARLKYWRLLRDS